MAFQPAEAYQRRQSVISSRVIGAAGAVPQDRHTPDGHARDTPDRQIARSPEPGCRIAGSPDRQTVRERGARRGPALVHVRTPGCLGIWTAGRLDVRAGAAHASRVGAPGARWRLLAPVWRDVAGGGRDAAAGGGGGGRRMDGWGAVAGGAALCKAGLRFRVMSAPPRPLAAFLPRPTWPPPRPAPGATSTPPPRRPAAPLAAYGAGRTDRGGSAKRCAPPGGRQ